MKLLQ